MLYPCADGHALMMIGTDVHGGPDNNVDPSRRRSDHRIAWYFEIVRHRCPDANLICAMEQHVLSVLANEDEARNAAAVRSDRVLGTCETSVACFAP
jgi:hypothetical protein